MSEVMSENPAQPVSSDVWEPISPKHRIDEWFSTTIFYGIIAGAIMVSLWTPGFLPAIPRWALLTTVGVLWLVSMIVVPFRVRAMKYRLRDDDFVYRRGIIFQRQVAVPYGRLQLIDVSRGPVARILGLSELRLVTASASSGVVIPGIRRERALELRDDLVAVAETRRAGL